VLVVRSEHLGVQAETLAHRAKRQPALLPQAGGIEGLGTIVVGVKPDDLAVPQRGD
jgi:hypothetical protein